MCGKGEHRVGNDSIFKPFINFSPVFFFFEGGGARVPYFHSLLGLVFYEAVSRCAPPGRVFDSGIPENLS